jgi:TolB-like protein/class 3 adenylate cyclase/Flp pilus assembly protein TadD
VLDSERRFWEDEVADSACAGGNMSSVKEPHLHLEVGHILFLDIVGYSKLLADEQKQLVQELNQIVRETEQFRVAEAAGKLTRLPTGDGMVLVFTNNPEAPVECALEISKALQSHPKLKLRMGIHSGPVNPVADVNDQSNLLGAGINVAQRVMYCGDAGHILLSKHFAEDLEEYAHWRSHLHDVGAGTDKHGLKIPIVNFYTDQLGNSALPAKLRRAKTTFRLKSAVVAALLLIAAVGVAFWVLRRSQDKIINAIAAIPYKSIAVLPFENLSRDPDNAYFADGTQNEILTKLAGIGDLKVISRTSSAKYKSKPANLKTVARELGVATVLEGTVQKAGEKVRVTVQLLDARSDTHLWAKSYDRSFIDIFAVQSDVAQEIADALQAKLSPSQAKAVAAAPTRDTEAYDLFLRGEYHERQAESAEDKELFDRAETFYRQALARDPTFALAYARLAYNRLYRHWFGNRLNSAQLEEVKSNIDRALAIAPDLPEAYLALGMFYYWGQRDFDSALRELDRAIELQPSNSDSWSFRAAIYRRRGEWRRSLAEWERALELNPRDSSTPTEIGNSYLCLRRWSDAEHAFTRALALDPHNINAAYHLAQTYTNSTGDIQRARQAWEGIPEQLGNSGQREIVISEMIGESLYLEVLEKNFSGALKAWETVPTNTFQARLLRLEARIGIQLLAGQTAAAKPECEEARVLLEAQVAKRRPEDRTSASELAWIYVCLGRNADALRIAREAVEAEPLEKDSFVGTDRLVGLAQIEAQTGQSEEAIKTLRHLLTIPAGEFISVTRLKIDPVWDPIRNDPGFQKLVSEPEPVTVYK